jgi:peptide-methionine (R)-S-oxide reductase
VGYYHCRVCENKLFSFDDKFKSETGYASFWNHRPNSLELIEKEEGDVANRHVCCSSCKCHIGKVYFDGPPPTFIRYQINSAALNFVLKPFFEDPETLQ